VKGQSAGKNKPAFTKTAALHARDEYTGRVEITLRMGKGGSQEGTRKRSPRDMRWGAARREGINPVLSQGPHEKRLSLDGLRKAA